MKSDRTLVVSTASLDEADAVADRVALLYAGNVRCLGSPAFLKAQLGGGYKLTIGRLNDVDMLNSAGDMARVVEGL